MLVICLLQVVYTRGPVLITMASGDDMSKLGGGVVPEGRGNTPAQEGRWCNVERGTTRLKYNHAMLVVGYTGPTPDSPNGSFIIKNSWGVSWAALGKC